MEGLAACPPIHWKTLEARCSLSGPSGSLSRSVGECSPRICRYGVCLGPIQRQHRTRQVRTVGRLQAGPGRQSILVPTWLQICMLVLMPLGLLSFARIAAMAALAFAGLVPSAMQASTPSAPLVIEGLGKGTAVLNGPWQFHPGDDPAWANPAFDSSDWEHLAADRPWGEQGHEDLTGFAWYRCSVALTPAPGVPPQFSLLVPQIADAYEIYWNGSLIGQNGRLPPRPVWYESQPAQTFELGQLQGKVQRGVLAVRVWRGPLLSDDTGTAGGFEAAPLIGSPEAIATAKAALDLQWLRSRQFLFGENLLDAVVALLSFLLWWRTPTRWFLFWMTGFALASPLELLLLQAHLGWPYLLAMGADQLLASARDIALWFLLLWILPLRENRRLVRLTRILACLNLANGALDGVLVAMSWNPQWIGMVKTADALSAFFYTLVQAFPLILASYALLQRRRLGSNPLLVAISAFLAEMLIVARNALKQGRQFTDWSIAARIDAPLVTLGGSAISLATLSQALLLVTIIYAVYQNMREDQRQRDLLEREKLELTRERNRMRYHAEHDGLTGLWNHRIIVERLHEEMNRSRRDRMPLSVVLIDVDHFKKINDTFGHSIGDLVLKEISAIFMHLLRPYDAVGRYGGEEFLLVLPGCGMEAALVRAEQLRLAVESARVLDGETTLQVTASFGVASDFPDGYEAEAVIRTVDAALYRAKSGGRNCVVSAEMNVLLCEN
jgi:diguanylate cyclase (GGDEF)-like protein